MKLFARITDIDPPEKSMHELGTAFYQTCDDDTVELVYLSGNRPVYSKGRPIDRQGPRGTNLEENQVMLRR